MLYVTLAPSPDAEWRLTAPIFWTRAAAWCDQPWFSKPLVTSPRSPELALWRVLTPISRSGNGVDEFIRQLAAKRLHKELPSHNRRKPYTDSHELMAYRSMLTRSRRYRAGNPATAGTAARLGRVRKADHNSLGRANPGDESQPQSRCAPD